MHIFIVETLNRQTMKKFLLISAFLVSLCCSAQKSTWVGVSAGVGLNTALLGYFEPDATIDATGFSVGRKFSKHFGMEIGMSRVRYNYDLSNIYYSFSRCPVSFIYFGRMLNIKPSLYFNYFHETNNTSHYYEGYSDLSLYDMGYGVAISKDIHLTKKILLEPEVTYMSPRMIEFLPEVIFELRLKYCL